jgi:hypothetical protein
LTDSNVPYTPRYLHGPLPVTVCRFNYFFKLVLTTQSILCLNSVMATRYIYIFWLKNPAAFHDEFWCRFC